MAFPCLSWAIVLALGFSPACGLSWSRTHGCNSSWGEYTQQQQPEMYEMSAKIRGCMGSMKELFGHPELYKNVDEFNGGLHGAGEQVEETHRKPIVSLNLTRTSVEALQSLGTGNGRNIVMTGDSTTRYSWVVLTCALMIASGPSDQSAIVTSADLRRFQCNKTIDVWCFRIRDTGVNMSYVWLQNPDSRSMEKAMVKLHSMEVPAGSVLLTNYGAAFNGGYLAKDLRTTARTRYQSDVEKFVGPIIEFASNRSSQVLWRETLPQHYGTESGVFPAEWPREKRETAEEIRPHCWPYTPDRDRAGFNYRNDVANSVMRRLGVPVISVYPVFCNAWLEHPQLGDCSHLSLDGNIALSDILLQDILRHSRVR